MTGMISYKIHYSTFLPYEEIIDVSKMERYEQENETIQNSRIYLICKHKRKTSLIERNPPYVLYVGETFKKQTRFKIHEKLLKATTIINTNEKLLVYFLRFRVLYSGINPVMYNPFGVVHELGDLNSKTAVWLQERILINLFNPVLNSKFKKYNIYNHKILRKNLLEKNIRYINMDIGINGNDYQFIGGNRLTHEDWYTLDLKNESIILGSVDIFSE